MTQDHEFLAVGTYGSYAYVFKHNGTQFNLFQEIFYESFSYIWISITNDHQYLTVSEQKEDKLFRYFYNAVA